MRLPGKNIVMELQEVHEGVVHLRLHLGHKSSLPAGFERRYCAESCGEWIWRQLMRCLGEGYSHFRMRVERYDETVYGVFSWRLEDAFRVLREAGFLLYDDGRGEWTPCNIYRHLVEQGRAEGGMLVLRERRGGFEKVQVF